MRLSAPSETRTLTPGSIPLHPHELRPPPAPRRRPRCRTRRRRVAVPLAVHAGPVAPLKRAHGGVEQRGPGAGLRPRVPLCICGVGAREAGNERSGRKEGGGQGHGGQRAARQWRQWVGAAVQEQWSGRSVSGSMLQSVCQFATGHEFPRCPPPSRRGAHTRTRNPNPWFIPHPTPAPHTRPAHAWHTRAAGIAPEGGRRGIPPHTRCAGSQLEPTWLCQWKASKPPNPNSCTVAFGPGYCPEPAAAAAVAAAPPPPSSRRRCSCSCRCCRLRRRPVGAPPVLVPADVEFDGARKKDSYTAGRDV